MATLYNKTQPKLQSIEHPISWWLSSVSVVILQVSWKADGTRYMMLIDGKDQTYFIDRDNCVFQVDNITFLHRKMPNKHIGSTLLDGVRLKTLRILEQIANFNLLRNICRRW